MDVASNAAKHEQKEVGTAIPDGINAWVFDLDNTLYPAECHLFRQIDANMALFIQRLLSFPADKARALQKHYYVKYGTTLSGLMREHGVQPAEFMSFVHDIDLSAVPENPRLAEYIAALPGQKSIFTNGSVAHAENVIGKIGLSGLFDNIFDIEAADFTPKPHHNAYRHFLARTNIDPQNAIMFEDLADNLAVPHALGMTTVLICSNARWMDDEPVDKRPATGDMKAHLEHEHIHHVTDDITSFLGDIVRTLTSTPTIGAAI